MTRCEDQILRELGIAPGTPKKTSTRRPRPKTKLVGVVACSSQKLDPADYGRKTLPAAKLYSASSFFRLASSYVAAVTRGNWVILSAKHGLVFPDQELALYNERLPAGGSKKWAQRVRGQLADVFGPDVKFLVVTGKDYQAHLFTPLSGLDYEAPLQQIKVKGRLGIGHYRAWLSKKLKEIT